MSNNIFNKYSEMWDKLTDQYIKDKDNFDPWKDYKVPNATPINISKDLSEKDLGKIRAMIGEEIRAALLEAKYGKENADTLTNL